MAITRRRFVNAMAASGAVGFARFEDLAYAASGAKAVAFDGFVIFDPRSIATRADELFPGRGTEIVNAWRVRQFEYTWLRTLTGNYAAFWQVTAEALTFTAQLLGLALTAEKRERLMGAFLELKAWPDVASTLNALKQAGIRMAFLTDFSASMLDANIRSAGLEGMFGEHMSTDRVRAFKPDPRAYQMGLESFKLRREEIVFAAFGGWDAAGAKRFGYPTFWCNRLNLPTEELGIAPDRVRSSTADLPAFVSEN